MLAIINTFIHQNGIRDLQTEIINTADINKLSGLALEIKGQGQMT